MATRCSKGLVWKFQLISITSYGNALAGKNNSEISKLFERFVLCSVYFALGDLTCNQGQDIFFS